MSKKIIRYAVQLSTGILIGASLLAIHKENAVAKAHKIRQQQKRYGSDFQLSEDKQLILQQVDQYLENHVGRKLASMMRTQEFYEHQIEKKLREKEEILSNLNEEDKEKIQELKDEILQLNRVYAAVKPKRITSWQELKQKQEEEEGY